MAWKKQGLPWAFDGAERVSEGAGRASDGAGRVSRGAGRLLDGAGMYSEEARRASQGAIVALWRALGERNREKKKWCFLVVVPEVIVPKQQISLGTLKFSKKR